MKKNGLIIFTTALLVFTACSGPAPSAASTVAPVSGPTSAGPAPTEPPAPPTATENSAIQVIITLADNTINSSLTTFQAGTTYSFVITNTGHRPHDFNISTPTSISGSLDASLASALLVVTQDQLSPGRSVTITFTFPASAVGAPLEFSCLIKRHYDDGMRLDITVTN